MRVLHLSTTGGHGGAGIAAQRIHTALLAAGVRSRMRVRTKVGDGRHVDVHPRTTGRVAATLASRIKAGCSRYLLRPSEPFSSQMLPGDGASELGRFKGRIVHLHWICDGFLGVGAIGRIRLPVVWTMHDQWPFTGGCHYSGDCEGYTGDCKTCPVLSGRFALDASRRVLASKTRAWKNLRISIVSPSRWLAKRAAKSTLFANHHIQVIPNPIDLETFRPIDKEQARHEMGLDSSKRTLLFGAMSATTDPRKGFDLLERTLDAIGPALDTLQLVVFGASPPATSRSTRHEMRYLGELRTSRDMALAYSAADIFVAPSRQDNLPNTVIESLACGTPVAAFRVGGIPDMVKHEHNGYLAEPFDTHQLARGITWILSDTRKESLSANARSSTESNYSPQTVAKEYLELYRSLISDEHVPSSG